MSLALAIRNNSQALAVAHTDYKKNLMLVGSFATSVIASNIPTLENNPSNIDEFTAAYLKAKGDALKWVNGVFARVTDAPQEVKGYNGIITDLLNDAAKQASALVNDPSDQDAQDALNNDLQNLQEQIGLVVDFTSGALGSARNFGNVLPDLAKQLQQVADDASQDAGVDQSKIDKLNADIQQYRQGINSLIWQISVLSVADTVEITLGTIVTLAGWPAGSWIWAVLSPAIAYETYVLALDAIDLKADKAKIAADQTQLKGLEADVAALHVLSQNFGALASQTTQVETALGQVVQQWQNLQSDIQGAVTDINDAVREASAKSFQDILSDVQLASSEWASAVAQAGGLAVSAKVNTGQFAVGMSSEQVQDAMAAGTSMGLIEYVNQPATS